MGMLLALLVFGVSAFVCHHLAGKRGLKPVFWGVLGFLFGPLVILVVLFAKPAKH